MIHMNVEVFTMVMEVLGLVSGVLGTIVIFFGFMSEKNEGRFSGRLGQLYSFLNFKDFIIEGVLKFLYVLAACLCTGIGFFMSLTVVNLSRGLVLLIGGNLAVRIAFEFLMLAVKACRNLAESGKGLEPVTYERPDLSEPVKEEDVKGENVQIENARENGRREDAGKEMTGEAAVTEEGNRTEVHIAAVKGAGPEMTVQENKKPDRKITLLKSKYKVCPSCGEKCSSEFAFCNMCGTKLP